MTAAVDGPPRLAPWRPVQFLGSKVRSLEFIAEAARSVENTPGVVWDAFSGSSVVSQRLAVDGNAVWASDALNSSAAFAGALLGVNRPRDENLHLMSLARRVLKAVTTGEPSPWDEWVQAERALVVKGDGPGLLVLGGDLPQRWRPLPASEPLRALFRTSEVKAQSRDLWIDGLLTSVYAGTYFGVEQALMLERIRAGIDSVVGPYEQQDGWARNGLLTALCHAASAAVFSPGKHFAQAHRIRSDKDLSFHGRRAVQDRSVDVGAVFVAAAGEVDRTAFHLQGRNLAESRLVEEAPLALLRERGVRTVYADPPYTAQQYSRFYHLLETLVSGVPPLLQLVDGKVTRGLYPTGRYLSPFSSRRQAPAAFEGLIQLARSAGANVLISYSASRGSATGNARMVSLEQIVDLVRDAYGVPAVSVEQLDLRYRQFNNGDAEVEGRHDPEFLVIGRSHAR